MGCSEWKKLSILVGSKKTNSHFAGSLFPTPPAVTRLDLSRAWRQEQTTDNMPQWERLPVVLITQTPACMRVDGEPSHGGAARQDGASHLEPPLGRLADAYVNRHLLLNCFSSLSPCVWYANLPTPPPPSLAVSPGFFPQQAVWTDVPKNQKHNFKHL